MKMTTKNPSWRIDELARRVLAAAKWRHDDDEDVPDGDSNNNNGFINNNNNTNNDCNDCNRSPTPNLDELERSLEIYVGDCCFHGAAVGSGATITDERRRIISSNDGTNGVQTCTVPKAVAKQSENDDNSNSIWTWTPQVNNANNTFQKYHSVTNNNAIINNATNSDVTTLEEMAPFSPDFYRCFGELVREAYHPYSVQNLNVVTTTHESNNDHHKIMDGGGVRRGMTDKDHPPDHVTHDTTNHNSNNSSESNSHHQAIHSIETYSLPRMNDAVRITRILWTCSEINVIPNNSNENVAFHDDSLEVVPLDGGTYSTTSTTTTVEDDKNNLFLKLLLHYCEGMDILLLQSDVTSKPFATPITKTTLVTNSVTAMTSPTSTSNFTTTTTTTTTGKRIPFLSAFFHHWMQLPQLEHALQQLHRKYAALLPSTANEYHDYRSWAIQREINISNTNNDGSIGSIESNAGNESNESRLLSATTKSAMTAKNAKMTSNISVMAPQSTSFLGERATRVDSLRMRLDSELRRHVHGGQAGNENGGNHPNGKTSGNHRKQRGDRLRISRNEGGLALLCEALYRSSDVRLRSKFRRWIGGWLRSFAFMGNHSSFATGRGFGVGLANERTSGDNGMNGGGMIGHGAMGILGPSFVAFCPWASSSSMESSNNGLTGNSGPISITHVGNGNGPGLSQNPLGMENTSACGIEALLQVLQRVIMGFVPCSARSPLRVGNDKEETANRESILRRSHESLLFDVLLPLHRPSGMVLWRDQTPLLELYHEALVKCIGAFVSLDRTLVGPIVGALLHPDLWPMEGGGTRSGGGAANTPKVVLLLHEADTLIGLLLNASRGDMPLTSRTVPSQDDERFLSSFDPHLLPLTSRLCACISSDNSRTSERALQFFRNETFRLLVQRRLNEVGPKFLRALCRFPNHSRLEGWEVPWNPTVRKMTLLVLRELEGYYQLSNEGEGAFERACVESFSGDRDADDEERAGTSEKTNAATVSGGVRGSAVVGSRPEDIANISGRSTSGANMTSLRGAMGSWRPPTQKSGLFGRRSTNNLSLMPPQSSRSKHQVGTSHRSSPSEPPLTVTGVAPWAVGRNRGRPVDSQTSTKQPPLTVTGVAPWALKQPSHDKMSTTTSLLSSSGSSLSLPRPSKKRVGHPQRKPRLPTANGSVEVSIVEEDETDAKQTETPQAHLTITSHVLQKVRAYMERLKPPEDEDTNDGVSSWAKAQMQESPALLPRLKFHDLVFGPTLGTGAFGTVKYARQILKHRTRSHWPEFAVKVVSTRTIREMGYESSINREIAILRTMSHPGLSRLVSSFRFRDGAYLVLEYASGGDLHALLRKNGSLDHESTRFVIGSVAAALWSIHERGFVYADCKPENILITETGHIKVTDFGACRPITEEARALVSNSSKNLLQQLRDGDWRPTPSSESSSDDNNNNNNNETISEDGMEDLRIEGTTAYLPPEVVMGGFPTTAADVWALGCVLFQCLSGRPPVLEDTDDLTAQKIVSFRLDSNADDLFGKCDPSTFRSDAKGLVRRMLNRDVSERPNILQIADDDFFEGMDVFNLHTKSALRLDVGSIAPASDAKWSRRQFSSIWAPQPHAYAVGSASSSPAKAGPIESKPICEGDEADAMFLPAQKTPLLSEIRE